MTAYRLELTAEEWKALSVATVTTCGHLDVFGDEDWCYVCDAEYPFFRTQDEFDARRRPIRIVFPLDIELP